MGHPAILQVPILINYRKEAGLIRHCNENPSPYKALIRSKDDVRAFHSAMLGGASRADPELGALRRQLTSRVAMSRKDWTFYDMSCFTLVVNYLSFG